MKSLVIALAAILAAAHFSRPIGRWLWPVSDGVLTYEQSDGEAGGGPYHRIQKSGNGMDLEYGFVSFAGDSLSIRFHLNAEDIVESFNEFGYEDGDVESMGGLDQQAQAEFFSSRGFKLLPAYVVTADIPALVESNSSRLIPVTKEFDRLRTEMSYGPWDTIGAMTAMAQTSVIYKIPPKVEGTKHIGGVFPPPVSLARGWGDCDTKSAILGAVMVNWDGLEVAGVGLPGHYLIGVQGVPSTGQAYVDFKGATYVLIEAAGPAWSPPGSVSDLTLSKLSLAQGVSIEPFSHD